jgi:hypothetical protein
MADHDPRQSPGGVPPGLPGAGWVLGTFVVFAIVVFTVWAEGWGTGGLNTAKAPAASQHRATTGSAPQNP